MQNCMGWLCIFEIINGTLNNSMCAFASINRERLPFACVHLSKYNMLIEQIA